MNVPPPYLVGTQWVGERYNMKVMVSISMVVKQSVWEPAMW